MAPDGDQGLWVVEDGRVTAHFDLPGTAVLVADSSLVYSDGEAAMVISPDMATVEAVDLDVGPSDLPPGDRVDIAPWASMFLPGDSANELWVVYFGRPEDGMQDGAGVQRIWPTWP